MYVNRDIHSGCYLYNKDDAKNPTKLVIIKKGGPVGSSLQYLLSLCSIGIHR